MRKILFALVDVVWFILRRERIILKMGGYTRNGHVERRKDFNGIITTTAQGFLYFSTAIVQMGFLSF